MSDCDICANSYTNILRKPIYCINCDHTCCLKCFKTVFIKMNNLNNITLYCNLFLCLRLSFFKIRHCSDL